MAMIEKKSLVLMRDVDGVAKTFPLNSAPAILGTFTYTGERMGGAPSITATLMYPRCLDDEWTYKEYVEFRGEKFYVRRIPTSSKSNEDLFYKHEVSLVSERDILEHVLFYDAVTDRTEELYKDRYRSNSTSVNFKGDIIEFASRINDSLVYRGLSDWEVKVYDGVTSETKEVSFEDEYIAEAMQEIYDTYELHYRWIGKTCYIGDTAEDILSDVTLEYGANNGLLSITKTNSENDIVDCITGGGSEDNIPWYYPNSNHYGTAIFNVKRPTIENLGDEVTYKDITSYVLSIDLETLLRTIPDPYNKPLTHCTRVSSITLDNDPPYTAYRPCMQDIDGTVHTGTFTFRYTAPKDATITIPLVFTPYRYIPVKKVYEKDTRIKILRYVITDAVRGTYEAAASTANYTSQNGDAWVEHTVGIALYVGNYGAQVGIGWYYKYEGVPTCSVFQQDGVTYDNNGETAFAPIDDIGATISLVNPLIGGDIITVTNRKWITPTGKLMPSIYRSSLGANRFYEALNETYTAPSDIPDTDKDAKGKYIFNNPYVLGNPHEAVKDFEDIKPSIVGVYNDVKDHFDLTTQEWVYQLFGEIADVAFDDNDSDLLATGTETESWFNEPDEYLHSYFYIKLHKLSGDFGFSLLEHALADESAYIEMTSGNCAGCKFQIGVYKKQKTVGSTTQYKFYNPVLVDDNGDIVSGNIEQKCLRESSVDNCQSVQQDTRKNEVWLAVKKDNDTFGVILPNATNNVKPQAGDTFVFTGISLPDELVYAAEAELEEELIRYMKENNDEHFTFSVTLSRIWLALHPDFTNALSENSKLLVRYNGVVRTLCVTSYTCKADDNILYEITVELSDEIEISSGGGLSGKIAEVATEVIQAYRDENSSNNNGYAKVNTNELSSYFLRSDQADSAYGLITFLAGLLSDTVKSTNATIGDFGTGFAAFLTSAGAGRMECDELYVRNKAIFNSLEIRKLSYTGGNIVLSPAGSVIERVTYITADGTEYEADENGLYVDASGNTVTPVTYRCYYKADDGTTATLNTWEAGDQAKCETFNLAKTGTFEKAENRYYWRLVTAVGNDYIDLSVSDCDTNSDAPAAGDTLVQMGNRNDNTRQNFLYLQSEGEGSPAFYEYAAVNSYSLSGKELTRISPVQGNLFTGTFQTKSGGEIYRQPVYRGDYVEGTSYNYYDQVTYGGELWLCIVAEPNTTTETPSDESEAWQRVTDNAEGLEWTLVATNDGAESVAEGETRTVRIKALKGLRDRTSEITTWKIERDTGDATADAVWNAAHTNFQTQLDEDGHPYVELTLDDLGDDVSAAKFTVTTESPDEDTNCYIVDADGNVLTTDNGELITYNT